MNSKSATAKHLHQFLEIVHTIQMKWEGNSHEHMDPWFRGQTDASKDLLPGLYRYDEEIDEDDFRDEFTMKAFPYLQQMRAQDKWESYALMQHYGLPTRLLDWSEAALVALHFAVAAHSPQKNAVVWMLDPWALNQQTKQIPYILDTHDVENYLPDLWTSSRVNLPHKPVAIQIPYNSPRISAQRGLFTIHGGQKDSLDDVMKKCKDRCMPITIPRNAILAIRRELYTAGVSESLLFPELGALCRDLKRHWIDNNEEIEEPRAKRRLPRK